MRRITNQNENKDIIGAVGVGFPETLTWQAAMIPVQDLCEGTGQWMIPWDQCSGWPREQKSLANACETFHCTKVLEKQNKNSSNSCDYFFLICTGLR